MRMDERYERYHYSEGGDRLWTTFYVDGYGNVWIKEGISGTPYQSTLDKFKMHMSADICGYPYPHREGVVCENCGIMVCLIYRKFS